MNETAIGASLMISSDVLDKITEAEVRIKRLEETTRTSSDKITKSFRSMGDLGVQYFIDKLKLAQAELEKFGNVNIKSRSNEFGSLGNSAAAVAASVTNAAVSMSQFGERIFNTKKNLAELIEERKKLTKELTKDGGIPLKDQQDTVNQLEKVNLQIKEQMKGSVKLGEEYAKSVKAQQAEDNKRYQAWLAQKDAELKEHIRVENEKFKRTKAIIDEQLKLFAELEKKKAEWAKQNASAKESGDITKANVRAQEKMYQEMFDKLAELKRKRDQEDLLAEQKKDAQIYKEWLARKDAELKKHKQVEDEKYKATVAVIEEQKKKFAELEKQQANWLQQNVSAKGSGERVNKEIREQEKAYERMFDAIEKKRKADEDAARKAAEEESLANKKKAEQVIIDYQRQIRAAQEYRRQQEVMYTKLFEQSMSKPTNALAFAESASSISQRTQAVKYLTEARAQLSTTDKNYEATLKRINEAIKRMNAENEKAVQGSRNLQEQHRNLINTSDQLARKLALVFSVSQIQGYVSKLVAVRGEFELQNTALASILGNKEQADKLFGQITELAVKSPFTVKELTTYTKSLAAYQVQYEDLYDTTKMLADVASGLGVDMQRLILAFGQVKAANFLRGTETRQFTEAGINMLGELAKYYSELEGRMVSVAEVQDRQFKRMISFADVEEVFKRLTSAGGMFYQMQEKQSETLKGLVSNLQDSFDIMFNSIGEANDGVLKGMVSMIKTLVDNWRVFGNIINASAIGFVAYTVKVLNASVATKAFAASNVEATIAQGGLNAVLGKTVVALKNVVKWVKANPYAILATAVAYATYSVIDHFKAVEKSKEEYDILSKTIQKSKNEIDNFKSKLDAANNSISENNKAISTLKKGTKEYEVAQDNLNKAQVEQNNILNELKSKYPEIHKGLVQQKDGTVDITEAQRAYNEELQKTLALNILMQNDEGFFSDGIKEDFKDYIDSFENVQKASARAEATLAALRIEAQKAINSANQNNKVIGNFVLDVASSSDNIEDKLKKIATAFSTISGGKGLEFYKTASESLTELSAAQKKLTKDSENAIYQIGKVIDNVIASSGVATDEQFKAMNEEAKKSAIKFAKPFLESIDGIKEEFVQKLINEQFSIRLGVNFDFGNKNKPELSAWQKRINEYIDKNKLEIKPIIADENIDAYFDKLRNNLSDAEKEAEKLRKATEQRGESGLLNEKQLDLEQNKIKEYTKMLKAFGEYKESKTEKKANKDALDSFKSRLSFLQRVNSEYEKLLKNYSKEKAELKVVESMRGEAKQLGIEDLFMYSKFDDRGILKAFEDLKRQTGNLSEEMSIAFAKAFGGIELGMDIEIREDRIKTIQDQFSKLFGNYELSLELDKLGLDKDVMSQLFNIEVLDLSELKKEIEVYKDELQNVLGKDGVSAWEDMNRKITEYEKKELESRLKQYAEYIKKSISAKAQAEIESQKEIAKIQKTKGLSDEVKNILIRQQREETVKVKAKIEWEDFKSSDTYIKLFEDLEYVSDAALKRIKQNLDMVKNSMGQLEPDQLKAIQDAYNKIEEQVISRNPFAAMRDAMKEVNELQKKGLTEDVLQQQLLSYDFQASALKSQITDIETIIGLKQNGISLDTQEGEFLEKNRDFLDKSVDVLTEMVSLKKSALSGIEANIGITNKDLNSYEKARMSLTKMSSEIDTIRDLSKNAFNSISSVLESLGVESDSIAMEFANMGMSMVDLVAQAVMFGIQLQLLTAAATALGVAINTALGPIGWAVMAIQGIATALTAIFRIGDKKKEREIQRQIEQVEKLQRSYEKLEEAINSAYSIDTLEKSTDQAIANLKAQNEALRKSIAAEEDKKKTDHDRIKEWEQTIEDNNERMKELQEDFLASLGGFGSESNIQSAAQEFADAWLDAYLETGNGLDALNDKWDEYIKNVIAKQLMLKGTEKYLKPVMDMLDGMLEDATFTSSEAESLQENIDKIMPQLNEFWESLAGSFDLEKLKESDTMSGLQRGIQSVTEETAQALEAILNSIRYFTSDSNMQLKSILTALTAPTPDNPYLLELKAQTEQLKAMNNLWNSLTKVSSGKGRILKVEIV